MDSEHSEETPFVDAISAFGDWMTSGADTIGPLIGIGVLSLSVIVYWYQRRKEKIDVIDRNLDLIQRLNELALEDRDNLRAAILSVHPDDEYDEEKARQVFFVYLRLNRMLRAFEYRRHRMITQREFERITNNYLGTLKSYQSIIPILLPRGYPPKFGEFVIKQLEKVGKVEGPKEVPKMSEVFKEMDRIYQQGEPKK